MYEKLAQYYDRLMEFDYNDYVEKILAKVDLRGKGVLELGCGTGKITERILGQVDHLVALDPSEAMLSVASSRLQSPKLQWLQGSTKDIPVSRQFDVIVACIDVINYIERQELIDHLGHIGEHLKEGGVFFFDLSSEEKLRETLGDHVYFYEEDEVDLVWINQWQEETRSVAMQLVFYENTGEVYIKSEEEQTQFAYGEEEIVEALRRSGFQLLASEHCDTRVYFLATR